MKNPIISRRRNSKRKNNWTKMSRNETLAFRDVHQLAGGLLGRKWDRREAIVNQKLFLNQKIS